jgi:hypothetical protein
LSIDKASELKAELTMKAGHGCNQRDM